jgi:hypothetical protein
VGRGPPLAHTNAAWNSAESAATYTTDAAPAVASAGVVYEIGIDLSAVDLRVEVATVGALVGFGL